MIMVLAFVSVTLDTTNQDHHVFKVLNAELTKLEKLMELVLVLRASPTTTEYVLNVLLVLSIAQPLADVSLFVAKTRSFLQRAILVFVFKATD